jgi:hypothetical protein
MTGISGALHLIAEERNMQVHRTLCVQRTGRTMI